MVIKILRNKDIFKSCVNYKNPQSWNTMITMWHTGMNKLFYKMYTKINARVCNKIAELRVNGILFFLLLYTENLTKSLAHFVATIGYKGT